MFLLFTFIVTAHYSLADTFYSVGVEIFFTAEGEGEAILLIHGFTASAISNFGAVGITRGLSSTHKVITLDNRGHGAGGKPHDSAAYGLQMVEDAINLLDHLNIERSHIVGYSMDGLITQKLLTLYPERVISAASEGVGLGW
jgi:pimeloyl-ACP methyl ester carboxylesterase